LCVKLEGPRSHILEVDDLALEIVGWHEFFPRLHVVQFLGSIARGGGRSYEKTLGRSYGIPIVTD